VTYLGVLEGGESLVFDEEDQDFVRTEVMFLSLNAGRGGLFLGFGTLFLYRH